MFSNDVTFMYVYRGGLLNWSVRWFCRWPRRSDRKRGSFDLFITFYVPNSYHYRLSLQKVLVMLSHLENLLALYSCGHILISRSCYAITPVCPALSPVFCSWSGVHSNIFNVALGKVAFQVGLILT